MDEASEPAPSPPLESLEPPPLSPLMVEYSAPETGSPETHSRDTGPDNAGPDNVGADNAGTDNVGADNVGADITGTKDNPGRPWRAGTLSYTNVGLAVLFSLLLWGDFAWSMKERSAAPILQILIKDFHASDSEMQLFMVVIPCAIGVLLGPVISYRSDRHRGKWGRRIPYLMISTPFAVLAMLGLSFSPSMGHALDHALGSRSIGPDACIRLLFGLFWVVFEVATVAANAVFGGLINDVVPKQFLGRFYGFFRAFSLLAGMVINYQILGIAETYFKTIFISIGLLYGVGFTLMCLTVKEGKYPPPPPSPPGEGWGFIPAAGIYLKECFSQPYYLSLIVAVTLGAVTFLPVNNFSQPFAKSLDISNDTYGKYIFATYLISLLLSYFLGSLADRFHPLRVGIAAMLLYACVAAWAEFYSARAATLFTIRYHLWHTYQQIPVHLYAIALIAHGVISGTFFTCTASLGQRLFPHGRFAQFASAAQSISFIAQIILGWCTGWFFDVHGKVYQHTYGMGCVLALAAALSLMIVHAQFMRYGGLKAYVAP